MNHFGHSNAKHLPVPELQSLKDYLMNDLKTKHQVLEGAFPYIVDTRCACSCSPVKEDFESLHKLTKPIVLKGVTGEQQCTHGGTLKVECINTNGDVVTL